MLDQKSNSNQHDDLWILKAQRLMEQSPFDLLKNCLLTF